MRKRKGAALPGAIMLCTLLMAVTFGVAFLVVNAATTSRVESIESAYRLEFESAYHYFLKNKNIDGFESQTFVYSTIDSLESENTMGVLAKNKAGSLCFYAIIDFDSGATLAYQTSDFYISVKDGKSYLGGLLLMTE